LVSPYINRFVSVDTIVPGYTNPQSLNRYSYVLNNPLRYNDPSGHRPENGYVGNHGSLNCTKYGEYCNNGKPKSADELAKMRDRKNSEDKDKGNILDHNKDDNADDAASEQTCWGCDPRVLTGTLALLEGTTFAGYSFIAYGAVIGETGLIGLVLGAPFLFTGLVGLDWAAYGAQEIVYSGSDKEADPIILVHLVFPNLGK